MNPSWKGRLTIEFHVYGDIELTKGQKIAHVVIFGPEKIQEPKKEPPRKETLPVQTKQETSEKSPKAESFTLKLSGPIPESIPPFSSFFVGRILSNMKAKHPDFSYQFTKDQEGKITEIVFRGVDDSQKKELESALSWAVKRVLEKESPREKTGIR